MTRDKMTKEEGPKKRRNENKHFPTNQNEKKHDFKMKISFEVFLFVCLF